MAAPVNWELWRTYRDTIEDCLRKGFGPFGSHVLGKGSSVQEAQRVLKENGLFKGKTTDSFLAKWVNIQEKRKASGQEHCCPNWTLFNAPVEVKRTRFAKTWRKWILTAAQDDTEVHAGFWTNLKAYAQYVGAQILIGPFTYQKGLFEDHQTRSGIFRPSIAEHIVYDQMSCGSVLFCAEMNTLPTADDPLSGLHTYSQGRWAVFPHAKRRLITVPSINGDPPVLLTTGCVTVENYIQKKAGLKATFHHTIGAVIVEEDEGGICHVRHLSATMDGSFQDLDRIVSKGKVKTGARVEAIVFGDIQSPFIHPQTALATWGIDTSTMDIVSSDNIVDTLKPKYGAIHDLIDFKSISHHDLKRPFEQQWAYNNGHSSIEGDIEKAAKFLESSSRPFMKTVAVESNHDKWLDRWLDDGRGLKERQNLTAFFRYGLARAEANDNDDTEFSTWRFALRNTSYNLENIEFIPEGHGFEICREYGGIQIGQHGHLGPKGGPATPSAHSKVSEQMTIGDKHSPEIKDGLYVAGVSCMLNLRFNKGASSWRHAHVLHYPNGRRTILFVQDGKWRA